MEFCKRAKDQTGKGGGNTGGRGFKESLNERYPNFIKIGNSTRLCHYRQKKEIKLTKFKDSLFNFNLF
jgi:hypothetical protein